MAVGDFKSEKGVKDLDTYLAERSYVDGYVPSQADVCVFDALGRSPSTATPHVLRWYNHISSFEGTERQKFPGKKEVPASLLKSGAGAATAPSTKPAAEDDDDDVDLFGSDEEEDADAAKIRDDRVKAYAAKKSNKPAIIAKSSIILDVKPWDDETDMKEMEAKVRTIVMEGLVWGASKLVPVGYGIEKLQIMCIVEDDKVSVDQLTEEIQNFEDFVQSVDIAAFNKI